MRAQSRGRRCCRHVVTGGGPLRRPGAARRIGESPEPMPHPNSVIRYCNSLRAAVRSACRPRDHAMCDVGERRAHPHVAVETRRGHHIDPDGGEALIRREADIPQRWTGQSWVSRPSVAPNHSRFYVARIDDRLLLRPTPEGVRLGQNFCEIRFRLFSSGGK